MRTYDFLAPLAFDHRFRPPVRPRRNGPAGRRGQLSALQHRTACRGPLPDSLAVAGFAPDDISITAEQNVVTIEGSKAEKAERDFLYRGISTRNFKRQFSLADYVQVKSAAFDNGLAQDRAGPGDPGSHEAAAHRDQRRAADNVQKLEAKAA